MATTTPPFIPIARTFERLEILPSYWTNRLQQVVTPLASAFLLRKASATVVEIVSPSAFDAPYAGLSISGRWRFVDFLADDGTTPAPVQAAHPGGSAGTYYVYAIAEDDNIVASPDPNTDETDYEFTLKIAVNANGSDITPAPAIKRLLGTVAWDGAAITQVNQVVGAAPPRLHAAEHAPGGNDPMAVNAAAGTGSLRTIGTGGTEAAAGNDGRFPSAGEKAALAGTSGTPGAGNKYVTQAALDALATAFTGAVTAAIAAETSARVADVDAEEAARIAADAVVTAAVTAETAARIADVDAEEAARIAADALLLPKAGGTISGNLAVQGNVSLGDATTDTVAFFGGSGSARTGRTYTVTSGVTDRTFDTNATTLDELCDIVATLIADFQAYGAIG